jgi:predicted RNA-binding Zn-ribbon protein involved in translation (DUF1610 family)
MMAIEIRNEDSPGCDGALCDGCGETTVVWAVFSRPPHHEAWVCPECLAFAAKECSGSTPIPPQASGDVFPCQDCGLPTPWTDDAGEGWCVDCEGKSRGLTVGEVLEEYEDGA